MRLYRRGVVVFSIVIALLGAAQLLDTAAHGGGAVGFLVGGLAVALGVARRILERKRGPL